MKPRCDLCHEPCAPESMAGQLPVCPGCQAKGPQYHCLNCDAPVWGRGTFCTDRCKDEASAEWYADECREAYARLCGEDDF
jgi:hypothetical protein